MTQPSTPAPPELSEARPTGWVLLVLVLAVGALLLAKVARTEGLASDRLWKQFLEDPALQFAGFDFFLTAGWAALVMIERSNLKSLRFWLPMLVFCAVPSLGLALYVLLKPAPHPDARANEPARGTASRSETSPLNPG